jgi:hypothetical protein
MLCVDLCSRVLGEPCIWDVHAGCRLHHDSMFGEHFRDSCVSLYWPLSSSTCCNPTYHTCRHAPFLCKAASDIIYHVWMQESEKPSTGQRAAYRMIILLCPIDVVWQAGVSLFHLILCWCPPFVIHVQYILAFILTARVISFANIYIMYTQGLLCHVGCNQQTRQRKYFSFRFCILNLPPIYHLSFI